MLHMTLFLVVTTLFSSGLVNAGGCGGSCAVSGGSSYNFLGDRVTNMDMSSFDDFVRENQGNNQTTFHAKPLDLSNVNLSIGQIPDGNTSQNATEIESQFSRSGNSTSDNRIIRLGASSMLDHKSPTMVPITSKGFMF